MAVACTDQITIYREHTLACLADLDQLGPVAQAAYEKVALRWTTPHRIAAATSPGGGSGTGNAMSSRCWR